MQTLEVINTIQWIESLFDEETKVVLFSWELFSGPTDARGDFSPRFLKATHELASASTTIVQNPNAMKVLEAFGLSQLTDRDYLSKIALRASGEGPSTDLTNLVKEIIIGWKMMVSCRGPLESLTIPDELRSEDVPPDIISLELRYAEKRAPNLEDFSKVAQLLQELYITVARIYRKKDEGALVIIKVDSGSSIRIDCKGLGDVIKHLKDFVIEAWNKFRHKRAEEVIENNRAILSSLAVMDHIAKREKDNSLKPEEAGQLRVRVLNATLGLFKCGALLTDIPPQETVDNTVLLQSFMPKLIEAPKDQKGRKPSKARKTRKRTSKPTKRKTKR